MELKIACINTTIARGNENEAANFMLRPLVTDFFSTFRDYFDYKDSKEKTDFDIVISSYTPPELLHHIDEYEITEEMMAEYQVVVANAKKIQKEKLNGNVSGNASSFYGLTLFNVEDYCLPYFRIKKARELEPHAKFIIYTGANEGIRSLIKITFPDIFVLQKLDYGVEDKKKLLELIEEIEQGMG